MIKIIDYQKINTCLGIRLFLHTRSIVMKIAALFIFLLSQLVFGQNTHPKTEVGYPLYLFQFGINSSNLNLSDADALNAKYVYFGLSSIFKSTETIDLSVGIIFANRGFNTSNPYVKTVNNCIDIPLVLKIELNNVLDFHFGIHNYFVYNSYEKHLDGSDQNKKPERVSLARTSANPVFLIENNVGLDLKLHTDFSLNIKYALLGVFSNRENLWIGISYIINHKNRYKKVYRNGINY